MSVVSANPMERLQSLTVADVMSRPVTVVPGCARMEEAARILADADASGAPVVDDAGHCIGVLSAADFLRFEVLKAQPDQYDRGDWAAGGEAAPRDSVRRFMTPAVQTAPAHESLLKAAAVMCLEHIHRLIVLDHRGEPIGVVSTLDVMSAMLAAIDEASQRRSSETRSTA
ncbi:MAG: hypothetical protein DCC67_14640 [Planctomycetota bacterium]|nr:MAG: hypothetical protein DCC67_14640 [Planctomycetota bacterium]